jgi:xanthine dehydrogenase accessory factor
MQTVRDGKQAAVVSKYTKTGIQKTLIREDGDQWERLAGGMKALEAVTGHEETTLIERYSPKSRLIIFGGGHIALPLVTFGAALGFYVVVFDDRPSFANESRFPSAQEVICDRFENAMDMLNIRRTDYVVIVTRGHRHDQHCLRGVLQGETPFYTGMIGSRRRVEIVKRQLREEGFSAPQLDQVHSPIGLAIGAATPEEIAVSILAEIIQYKRLAPSAQTAEAPQEAFASDMDAVDWLAKNNETAAAMVTVIASEGSTPRETGAKMLVLPWGDIIGSIGGGCAEADVIGDARDIIREGGYCLKQIDLTDSAEEDGMVCGGIMHVLIERVDASHPDGPLSEADH